MSRVERFEDFVAWQKARRLTREVYEATRHDRFRRDVARASQMQRAAVSIMSNIAEGFERGSRAEFHRFLLIAKASAAELRSQLDVALDVEYVDTPTFERLLALTEEVGRIIGGLRAVVERQRHTPRVPA